MSESKALPVEIIQKILKHVRLQTDRREYRRVLCTYLHVNRGWCSVVVRMLWDKPFKYAEKSAHALIETYLGAIDDDQREMLWFNNIPAPKRRALFSYPCFLQELDVNQLRQAVEEWLSMELPNKWSSTEVQMVTGVLCQTILTQATLNTVTIKEEGLTVEEIQFLKVFFEHQRELNDVTVWFAKDMNTPDFANLVAVIVEAQLGPVERVDLIYMQTHMDDVLQALKRRSSVIKKVMFSACDLKNEHVKEDLKELSKLTVKTRFQMCMGMENSRSK